MKFTHFSDSDSDDYLEAREDEVALHGKTFETPGNVLAFHCSPRHDITEILESYPRDKRMNKGYEFGGLFVSPNIAETHQYGTFYYEVEFSWGDIADPDCFEDMVKSKKGREILSANFTESDYENSAYQHENYDEYLDTVADLVVNSIHTYIMDLDYWEEIEPSHDDAAWRAQTIRSELAKAHGYKGVQESDGILIFPGAEIKLSPLQYDLEFFEEKGWTCPDDVLRAIKDIDNAKTIQAPAQSTHQEAEFDAGATITKSGLYSVPPASLCSANMTESDLMASFDAMDAKLGSDSESSSLSIK